MQKGEKFAIVGALCIAAIVAAGLAFGWWSATSVLTDVLYVLIASVVAVLVWGFKGRFRTPGPSPNTTSERGPAETTAKSKAAAEMPPKGVNRVRVERLMTFNLRVKPGEYEERPISLSKGEVVEGTLVERSGQDFDWSILDDAGYVAFVAEEPHRAIQSGLASPSAHVHFIAPKPGGFHLILDCNGRRYTRTIEVRLSKQVGY